MIDNKFYKDLDYEYTRYPRYEQNILNIHIGTWMLFFFSMFFSMNFMKNIYILAIGTLLIILTYIIYINIYKKFMKNLNEIKNNNDSELDDFINDDNIIVSNIMNEINVDDNAKEMFKKTLIKSIREDNQNFFDFIESKIIIKGAVDINVLKNFYENTDLKLNTNIKVIDEVKGIYHRLKQDNGIYSKRIEKINNNLNNLNVMVNGDFENIENANKIIIEFLNSNDPQKIKEYDYFKRLYTLFNKSMTTHELKVYNEIDHNFITKFDNKSIDTLIRFNKNITNKYNQMKI